MCDLTELRDHTPEQFKAICEVFRLRLLRDQALPRNPFHKSSASADVPPNETAAVGAALEFFA